VCLSVFSTRADASFIAAVCQDLTCSSSPIIVSDNGAGDTIPGTGAISFSVAAFGYSLVVNTSQSKPVVGSSSAPQLDLTFTATGSGTIFLYAGDTDFTGGAQAFTLSLGETSSGGSGAATGRAWGGTTNNALTFSPLISSIVLSGVAASSTATGTYNPTVNPYSLSIGVQIVRTTAGTTTGDLNFSTAATPEPTSLAMLGIGLGFCGFAVRRRKA